ncbi:SMI1/KNR4 family protein [Saccharibacillus sacchari]|uniref:SMI1/KNR4 family protein n=1 Tax=Saccharibacillus sacchari TaxID=456493 RepID=UPI0004BB0D18|nr:SMI1/KNR4 family protein [Saccharibacillus sacchari]
MNKITKARFEIWIKEWDLITKQITDRSGQSGGGLYSFVNDPENMIQEIEQRLGLFLPEDLKDLIRFGYFHAEVDWAFPDGILIPFPNVSEGDLGWNIKDMDFPGLFDDNGDEMQQRRYLAFHMAGNGDLLLFDLESASGSAVVSWSHEEDEFRLLAPSLPDFFERITKLGLIGAYGDSYVPFLGADGLEPDGTNGQLWQAWLKDYRELQWEDVQNDLPAALRLFEMIASDDPELTPRREIGPLLKEYHSVEDILREWIARGEEPQPKRNRRDRLILIGEAMGSDAADWVRTLWTAKAGKDAAERPTSEAPLVARREADSGNDAAQDPAAFLPEADEGVLHRLAAVCLPEDEGLPLVLRDIEREARQSGRRISPPTYSLAAFHSRRVIPWIEPHVSFPFSGWDTLLAASRPQAEDLIRWLQSADALRMTAVSAIGLLPEDEIPALFAGPNGHAERTELLRLLETLHASAVLRKEKTAISEAIAALAFPLT